MKHQAEQFAYAKSIAIPVSDQPYPQQGRYLRMGKRIFDLTLILLSLPITLPVIAIMALLVMRDGASPFFGHKRIGRDGQEFYCWKLRSMVPDSAERLRAHLAANPAAKAEWEANFKLDDDPRITRIGNFLRKSSLDELPQILNILRGEMSCVGPRPVTAIELERYGKKGSLAYKAMRPGLTGLWQVSGRNDVSYAERVNLDIRYARRCSLKLDLYITWRTLHAVLARTGR